jgi:glycerophosphoryl diester phosphodiesterase
MTELHLVAHRGCPLLYPENSLEGYRAAMDAGARFIETDVLLSANGTPVLFHDRDLMRVCGKPGAIHDYSDEALRDLRPQYPDVPAVAETTTSLASLDDFLALLSENPQVTAFVEIKRQALEHHGIQAVLDSVLPRIEPLAIQIVLISFSVDVLEAAKERGWRQTGAVLLDWEQCKDPRLVALELDYLFCNIEKMPSPHPPTLPSPHTRFAVYDVTDFERARALAKNGIHYVETFTICELLAEQNAARDEGV